MMTPSEILISAGEASGEMYAAQLAKALASRTGAHLFGMGGPRMRDAGVELVADFSEIAVVGITEVFIRLPAVWRAWRRLDREAKKRRPAIAILVDSPGFNLGLARRLRKRGVKNVYFISPQIWAWRPRRIRWIQQRVARMLVIFPFEVELYRTAGVAVDFVGHPLVDSVQATMTREEFAARFALEAQQPIVALLPGSRPSEVRRHLPVILEACARLRREFTVQFVLVSAPGLGTQLFEPFRREDVPLTLVKDVAYDALAAADCAIVSSGTATLEAALLGVPMVVVYRLSGLTALIARRLVVTPLVGMVNLIAGRQIAPELLQEKFTPEAVESEVRRLLDSPEARARQKQNLAEVRSRLGPGGAIDRAAEIIASLL